MDKPKCTANSKQSGQRCKRYPAPGSTKCFMHGGRTAKGRQRALEGQARAELARLDIAPVEDPLTELAAVTAQVLAWKDSMAVKVNDLTSLRYESEGEYGGGEQLRAEVALWERALDRCERFLTAMARLNIDERLARITEARATAVIVVFMTALDVAGIEGAQRDAVLTAADAEFARQAGVML